MTAHFPPGPAPAKNMFDTMRIFQRFRESSLRAVSEDFQQYGDIYQIQVGGGRQYVTRHPDHFHEILVEKANIFHKNRDYTDPHKGLARFLGTGLLTSNGDFWKRQRRLAAPALHARRIAAYAGTMARMTQTMLDSWHNQPAVDVDREMMQTTFHIVTKTLFNAEVSDEAQRVGDAMTVLQEMTSYANMLEILLPHWVPTPQRRREARAVRDLDEIVYRLIRERHDTGDPDYGDLLSMLMLAEDEDGSHMSDKQVRDEVVTMFLAGHETTANTLNWTLYLLAQHPEVEARLHEELDTVLAGRTPTLEDLKRLPYTDMVIKESMRLYPPAFVTSRVTIADTTLGGYTMPAGTEVSLFSYSAHHDPKWWNEPEVFDPQRFSPENEQNIYRFAYLPFGAGPRVCIGNTFAKMEAQIMLAMIAQRYELRLSPGQIVEPDALLTLRPKGGLHMNVRQRQPVRIAEMA